MIYNMPTFGKFDFWPIFRTWKKGPFIYCTISEVPQGCQSGTRLIPNVETL